MLASGCAVTTKSVIPPVTVIGKLKVKVCEPVLLMVKVWLVALPKTIDPKSVPSAVNALDAPSVILVLLPMTSISGATPVPWMAKL